MPNSLKSSLIQQLKSQGLSIGILSADWLQFADSLRILEQHRCNVLHFDIADGQFSPLFTVGAGAIKSFPDSWFKDVHLMVKDQLSSAQTAVKNGANLVSLQLEQQTDLAETLVWLANQFNRYQGETYPVLIGLSLCPDTELSEILPYCDQVDVFQLLTLDPRTGQKFPKESLCQRINELHQLLSAKRQKKLINIDGSMTLELAQYVRSQSDIDWLVSGSALFADDLDAALTNWKQLGVY